MTQGLLKGVVEKHVGRKLNRAHYEAMQKSCGNLLGCESVSRMKMDHLDMATRYAPIALDFLRMRTREGFPLFAVFDINRPDCQLRGHYDGSLSTGTTSHACNFSELGEPNNYFGDVFKKLERMAERRVWFKWVRAFGWKRYKIVDVTISQTFQGIIPNEIREAIKAAKNDTRPSPDSRVTARCFDSMYLITEAGDWNVSIEHKDVPKPPAPPRMPDPDPLIIGWNNSLRQAYLVATFDMTTVEEMVAREFTEGELPVQQ